MPDEEEDEEEGKKSCFQTKVTTGTQRNPMHTGTNPTIPMFP